MSISVLSRKQLWGRAGNRCAFPDCRATLNESSENLSGGVVVGEEAHIVARESGGPRGNSALTEDERDDYANLILLCRRHHKIIDTDVVAHTVRALHLKKLDHEHWVEMTLGTAGLDIVVRYAEVIDKWATCARLDRWHDWTDSLARVNGPALPMWGWHALVETNNYLESVIWPKALPDLERAFANYGIIVSDLLTAIDAGQPDAQHNNKWLALTAPRHPYTTAAYNAYSEKADLVTNLTLELTRAGNHLCDVARARLDPKFRLAEGYLGVTFQSDVVTFPKYQDAELAALYPGRAAFAAVLPGRSVRVLPTTD